MVLVRMMTLLSKSPPECDVEFLSQKVFASRFVGVCHLHGQLDAADVPNFQIFGNIEKAISIRLNATLLAGVMMNYDGNLSRYVSFFL